jgi:hypothetical protein
MPTPKQIEARKKNWNIYMLRGTEERLKNILNHTSLARTVRQHLKMAIIDVKYALEEYKKQTD